MFVEDFEVIEQYKEESNQNNFNSYFVFSVYFKLLKYRY